MSLVIIDGDHYIGATVKARIYDVFGNELNTYDSIRWYGANSIPIDTADNNHIIQYENRASIQLLTPIPDYIVAVIDDSKSDPFMIMKCEPILSKQEKLPTIGSGINLDNPVSRVSGLSNTSTNISRVNQSLKMILSIAKGEYPMIPNLGSRLYLAQFRTIYNETDLESIRQDLLEDIQTQEPRINVLSIEIDFDYIDTLRVRIEYNIKNTNISGNLIYNQKVGSDVYA